MKNTKKITSMLLLVLFAFAIPQTQAAIKNNLPVYKDVISEISLGYQRELLCGHIVLASGAILHIVDYKTRDDTAINKWSAGNVVVFSPHAHKGKLILTVNRVVNGEVDTAVEPYVIFDTVGSPSTMLAITEVKEKGKFIKLSDNSVWEFSFFNRFSTEDWHVGERVLVNGLGNKNAYTFINVDVPLKYNEYSATGSFIVD